MTNCAYLMTVVKCNISASEKLEVSVLRVVLETDGTEIDGNEELMAFSGSTLLALQQGESWMPEAAAMSESLPPIADNVSETPSASDISPALPGELMS